MRLCRDGEAELDVRLDDTGVQRRVECAEFNRPFLEDAVQVETAVAAGVVVHGAAVVALIPELFERFEGCGLAAVEFAEEVGVDRLAIGDFPVAVNLQGAVDHILLGGHDVDEIAQLRGREGGGVDVDVDAAGAVDESTGLAEVSHQLLQIFDVLVAADGADQFHGVLVVCGDGSAVQLSLAGDASVPDHLPDSALLILDGEGPIRAAFVAQWVAEELGHHLRGAVAGNAGHLDLDAEALFAEVHWLTSFGAGWRELSAG